LLTAVVRTVSLREGEAIVMDTQAGVEHFGRALAKGFRHALVVTDPTFNGVQVALQAARLARELGIEHVHLVINRARDARDVRKVERLLVEEGGFDFTSQHVLPHDERVPATEPEVDALFEAPASELLSAVDALGTELVQHGQELIACAS
jgi:CO dehydrogenase maturation factor